MYSVSESKLDLALVCSVHGLKVAWFITFETQLRIIHSIAFAKYLIDQGNYKSEMCIIRIVSQIYPFAL
jgi:hypothetical protein